MKFFAGCFCALLLCAGVSIVEAQEPDARIVFATLDKVTARIGSLEVAVGDTAQFGTLKIHPRYCRKNPPEERAEVFAFVEIFEDDGSGNEIFSGWMFASSPGLNALEHPVYDIWVTDCKTQLSR
ncbi:MAG: DUF2155 domain-containing protein [Hyphomicrobiales bacterium]|nr:DUF2155 domain-containing protein [Hyphomicrobiales bacterium]MCY4049695.1 DUF2155 domain-containing protein [Hyphomicrobiales bacterium]MCY4054157.1 DUF2155 domain-containing protein [Hyphomicrobiales bacterium]